MDPQGHHAGERYLHLLTVKQALDAIRAEWSLTAVSHFKKQLTSIYIWIVKTGWQLETVGRHTLPEWKLVSLDCRPISPRTTGCS